MNTRFNSVLSSGNGIGIAGYVDGALALTQLGRAVPVNGRTAPVNGPCTLHHRLNLTQRAGTLSEHALVHSPPALGLISDGSARFARSRFAHGAELPGSEMRDDLSINCCPRLARSSRRLHHRSPLVAALSAPTSSAIAGHHNHSLRSSRTTICKPPTLRSPARGRRARCPCLLASSGTQTRLSHIDSRLAVRRYLSPSSSIAAAASHAAVGSDALSPLCLQPLRHPRPNAQQCLRAPNDSLVA